MKIQQNTSVWQLGPRPGNMSQNGQKPTSLMSLPKNPKPKILFQCRLEGMSDLLRVWTAL